MEFERLEELKAEFENDRTYNDMHWLSTVTEDDVLELIDEAIARQTVTSEEVGTVIKLMQAYGKNITSKCQIEGTIFYDTGSPCTRHRFGEDTIDIIIAALQAYQPTISKTETTSCEWCDGKEHTIDSRDYTCLEITGNKLTAWGEGEATGYIKYCPNCGRRLENDNGY